MDGRLSGVALIEREKVRKRHVSVGVEGIMAGVIDRELEKNPSGID